MPNAQDTTVAKHKTIFMIGDTGSGKTTQFLTLSGKKYLYIFDPNALQSIKGQDIEYDEFLATPVSSAVASLSKSGKADSPSSTSSDVFRLFEKQFDERTRAGFFDSYDWIGFDSATTLLDLIMDRVLTLNGRFGQWPQQDDYGPQIVAFVNLCRTITAMGKGLYMTGHLEEKQDQKTQRFSIRPMMTGRLIVKIPLLFSEVFVAGSDIVNVKDKDGAATYTIQTVRSGTLACCRTSIRGLSPIENVTIDWSKPVVGQGIGGILNWAAREGK